MIGLLETWFSHLLQSLWPITLAVLVLIIADSRWVSLSANSRAWLWRLFFAKCLLILVFPWSYALPGLNRLPSLALPTSVTSPAERQTELASTSALNSTNTFASVSSRATHASVARYTVQLPTTADLVAETRPSANSVSSTLWSSLRSPRVFWFVIGFWSLAVLVQVMWLWHMYARVLTGLRRRSQLPDHGLSNLYRSTATRLHIKRPPRMRLVHYPRGPAIVFHGSSEIVLPVGFRERFGDEACRMALAHELSHFVRRDVFWNFLATIVSILYFFFPPIWFAMRRYRIAVESACDLQAIERAKLDRVHYAKLLVEILESPVTRTSPALLPMARSESFHTVSERLNAMKLNVRSSRFSWLATSMLIATIAILVAPWSQADEPKPKKKSVSGSVQKSSTKKANKQSSSSESGSSRYDSPSSEEPQTNTVSGQASFNASGTQNASGAAAVTFGSAPREPKVYDRYGQPTNEPNRSGSFGGSATAFGSASAGGFSGSTNMGGSAMTSGGASISGGVNSTSPNSFGSSLNPNSSSGSSFGRSDGMTSGRAAGTSNGAESVSVSQHDEDGKTVTVINVKKKNEEATIRSSDEDGIEVIVMNRRKGKNSEKTYKAESAEEFKTKHPSIYPWVEKYLINGTDGENTITFSGQNGLTVAGQPAPINVEGMNPKALDAIGNLQAPANISVDKETGVVTVKGSKEDVELTNRMINVTKQFVDGAQRNEAVRIMTEQLEKMRQEHANNPQMQVMIQQMLDNINKQ